MQPNSPPGSERPSPAPIRDPNLEPPKKDPPPPAAPRREPPREEPVRRDPPPPHEPNEPPRQPIQDPPASGSTGDKSIARQGPQNVWVC